MRSPMVVLVVASLTLLPALAVAQGSTTPVASAAWKGKSVALARVEGRSIAPACPKLAQIDHFVRERAMKWDDASLGCRFMLSGNFAYADVVEESGDYIRVRFGIPSVPRTETFWAPRRSFRLAS